MDSKKLISDDDILVLSPLLDLARECPVQFRYYIGIDIGGSGKGQDATVIITVQEKRVTRNGKTAVNFDLLDLVKLKTKTDFMDQAALIAAYLDKPVFRLNDYKCCMDAGGIAAALHAYLKRERPDLSIRPILITSGEGKKFNRYSRNYLLGLVREWLCTSDSFRISTDVAGVDELRRQIEQIEETETAAGNRIFKVPLHDDELIALSLSLIEATARQKVKGGMTDMLFRSVYDAA